MPTAPARPALYPTNWKAISFDVRFVRAGGRCQDCGRRHMGLVRTIPGWSDGRWYDEEQRAWRDGRGRKAPWPDLFASRAARLSKVVLASAHLDGNRRRNSRRNLRALCQKCHLLQDRRLHLSLRWLRRRGALAAGDLFLGAYEEVARALALDEAALAAADFGPRILHVARVAVSDRNTHQADHLRVAHLKTAVPLVQRKSIVAQGAQQAFVV